MVFIRRPRLAALFAGSLILSMLGAPLIAGSAQGAAASQASMVTALPGYQVSVFARGTASYSHPDSVATDGSNVWIGYQNVTLPDGTDGKSSTVVEYSARGQALKTYSVMGHNDGLRIDPTTHMVWAVSNEDLNPRITAIDPKSGSETPYTFGKTAHGGGFDDLGFTNGMVFISASNPTLDKAGINSAPALDTVTLGSNGLARVAPILMGNGAAVDRVSHAKVTLNLIDPDSITFDLKGDLVLDNQAGSQLLFISHPGAMTQSITSLNLGTQVDDTVWPTSAMGRLLICDTSANTIYALSTSFVPGSAFSAAPSDSGVAGMVAKLDPATGILTPVVIGLKSPHGMAFTSSMGM